MEAAIKVLPTSGQDRAIALPTERGYLVAVADGAGGTSGGAAAAERLIAALTKMIEKAPRTDWFSALCTFDDELSARPSGGQTTAVVAFVDHDRVVGASVGDSSAWLISTTGEVTDLTALQRRKPLLGSGEALPVEFAAERRGGWLLLATDGLTKYAAPEQICSLARKGTVAEALDALANCVRLPTGGLQDDVAVVLVSSKGPSC